MDLHTLRTALLAKRGAVEDFPFGPTTLVAKVGGKMFALVGQNDDPLTVSLKCDPAHIQFLRDTFPAVRPGYHLNKDHWNTVTLDNSIPDSDLHAMIDDSYRLVVKGLTRAARRMVEGE